MRIVGHVQNVPVAILLSATLLVTLVTSAPADTRSEMLAVMDKLSAGGEGAAAVVDWDNLVVKAPQLKGMDVHKMYSSLDDANKKAFRASFIKSFSASFKQATGGRKFSDAVKAGKGVKLKISEKGSHPSLDYKHTGGAMHLGFVRKSGKLLIQQLVVLDK